MSHELCVQLWAKITPCVFVAQAQGSRLSPPLITATFTVLGGFPCTLGRCTLGRSRDGAHWMGDTLARALATVCERQGDDDGKRSTPAGPKSPQGAQDGGGLRGVCRALFYHCLVAVGYVDGPSGAEEEEGLAVSGSAGETWFKGGVCLHGRFVFFFFAQERAVFGLSSCGAMVLIVFKRERYM